MKKVFSIVVLMLAATLFSFGQHYIVKHSDYNRVNLSFKPAEVQVKEVALPEGTYSKVFMEDYLTNRTVGCPELPMMSKLIEIPLCDSVIATITESSYEEFTAAELGIGHDIIPVQPAYAKSYTGERPFVKNAEVYSTNDFYAEPLVRVEKRGTLRDMTMATIYVSPMQYNPVTKKVRIYTKLEVTITYVNANIPGTYEMKSKYGSPMFKVASEAVINPMETRDEFNGAPIKYLIIAHSMFANNDKLNQLIAWKKRLGYIVEVGYTSDANVGTTTTSIKNFIMTHYTNATPENPAPTFLLFVGDVAQIPSFNCPAGNGLSAHVSDLYYATWTSGDVLPDCYYGRLSAENVSQLTPQLDKTLMYEQYTMPDPSYLGKAVLIAGTDANYGGKHGDGQVNYIYNNYINPNSTTHDYTTVYKHNYNCTSQAATIRSEIGAGVGWANYTAHGSETGWADPSFSNSDVPQMNNVDKYGIMIGNCCVTGKFNYSSPCFGETLLRAANKGAALYIGCSENSLWNEDFYWAVGVRSNINANPTYSVNNLGAYDRNFHTHGEDHSKWVTSAGGIIHGGNMSVESSTSENKQYYWEIYHIFGDPSIKPYLGIPSTLPVIADEVLMIGAIQYQVEAVPYAYCALTHNGTLVGSAFADENGIANITFDALGDTGRYELAVTAQDYIQYFKDVNVLTPTGAYVVASTIELTPNSQPINGSSVSYNLTLSNLGISNASNITAVMTSQTPGYVVTQNTVNCSSLSVSNPQTFTNAFTVSIPQYAEDGDKASFKVTVSWGNNSSSKNVTLNVIAPKVQMQSSTFQGSGNSFEPGDQITANIVLKNIGHANAQNVRADLTCNYSGVTVATDIQNISTIAADNQQTVTFDVNISSTIPTVSIVPLYFHTFFEGKHLKDTLYLTVGKAMEDFESGNLTQYNWTNNNNPWVITTNAPYAGNYCARSKEGLSDGTGSWFGTSTYSVSAMQITINVNMSDNLSYFRRVSSEQGWDFFRLYIDGNVMEEASGTVNWGQMTFPVTTGTHTIKFSYEKDASNAAGSDCAWVDNIILPGIGTRVIEDIVDPTGIADHEGQNVAMVRVYPNPATNQVTVNSNEPIRQIAVYDLSGRMVEILDANGDESVTINVNKLQGGIYFIRTTLENQQVKTSKLIKQ